MGRGIGIDAATTQRRIDALEHAIGEVGTGTDVFAEASHRLQEIVPFDGAAWFGTDPTTVLGTAPVRIENVEDGHCDTFWERECQVEDAILFRDLARAVNPVSTLHDSTGGALGRSARYREFLAPQGYGDELRAACRTGPTTWGVFEILRDQKRTPFSAQEQRVVATIAPILARGLRTLATAPSDHVADPEADGPGTALLDADCRLISYDAQAARLFEEIGGTQWRTSPPTLSPLFAVAARALAVDSGRDRGPASARVRAPGGRWLSVHASCLRGHDDTRGPTALTIEPAKSAQIAPIIVEAYCLTVREQQITGAVARGLSNPEIAAALHLSPHTVRDHLKAVFAKIGVGSRGELVAKLFADHYGPALHAPDAEVVHVEV